MVATSGAVLADANTVAAFERLASIATIVTPNLPELSALGGEAAVAARVAAVLVKGGHGEGGTIIDRLIVGGEEAARWSADRIATPHTHGTGCTLASAIAVHLARGMCLKDAVAVARQFVRLALHDAPGLGLGHGPLGQQRVRMDGDLGGATPNHVTVPATDHAASVAFYRALGLALIVESRGRYARFESVGGTTVSVEAAEEVHDRPILFLEVGDVDAAVANARAAGIAITDPVMQPWGWREARFADPAGNALCLYAAGEQRRHPPWRLADA